MATSHERTTASIDPSTADAIHDEKDRGESMDDVIRRNHIQAAAYREIPEDVREQHAPPLDEIRRERGLED